ncbi:hypothetical protein BKA93DRAFT_824156 [Sparassis latifolia]|uniref:Uncharacterized protein n=1 Tax=Sparassis crispa TaxID=139825 RepID=A0A401H2V0_9APHY|nr:hypothetical protein SCP_1400950 [Sparassis crispa]GBE88690.1 hypothetical protein SCP_1400950 [Sparassis crispa]
MNKPSPPNQQRLMILGGSAVALAVAAMYYMRSEKTATAKKEDANPVAKSDVRQKAGSSESK